MITIRRKAQSVLAAARVPGGQHGGVRSLRVGCMKWLALWAFLLVFATSGCAVCGGVVHFGDTNIMVDAQDTFDISHNRAEVAP